MAVGKEIKEQISSVQSTQKITSAMEKVAVSKMRRENCFYRREEFSMIGLTGTLFAHSKGLWHGRADSHCADNNHKLRQRRRPQG